MHPDNETPINHIKPPKPKPPNPSTGHYPPPPPPVTINENNYLCARTCDSGSSLTLVLLGPNTQPYTDNYGLNRYHPTPTTILFTSPPTYKPIPLFTHKNALHPPSIPPPPKAKKKENSGYKCGR